MALPRARFSRKSSVAWSSLTEGALNANRHLRRNLEVYAATLGGRIRPSQ
jgi:hypothetical protein